MRLQSAERRLPYCSRASAGKKDAMMGPIEAMLFGAIVILFVAGIMDLFICDKGDDDDLLY